VLVSPDQVLVNGKGFGQVNFIAWEQSAASIWSSMFMCAPIYRSSTRKSARCFPRMIFG